MRALVIGALLLALAGCGGDAPTPRVEAPTARPQAKEIVDRELDAIIENDKGRRLSTMLTAPRSSATNVVP